MSFSNLPAPKLSVSVSSSGVTTKTSFPMVFTVKDSIGGLILSESFTLVVYDCSSLTESQLSFNLGNEAMDGTGVKGASFEWNVSLSPT